MVENKDSLDLIQLLKYLRTQALLIFCISAGVTTLVYCVTLTIDDYYTSSARLTIAEQQSPPSGSSDMLGSFSGGGGLSMVTSPLYEKVLEVQELMNSRDFLRHVLSIPSIYDNIVYAESYNANTS